MLTILLANSGTADLALTVDTNRLVKQYNFTKIATTTLVKCLMNWNMIGYVCSSHDISLQHIVSGLIYFLYRDYP